MSLNPNTGSIITQEQAKTLIDAFAKKFPGEVVSSFIGGDNVKKILEQEDCIGLRIYNGYNDAEQKISLVVVGVNSNEEDMLENGIIYDRMALCPPICPKNGLV
nr:hypothetical protein [uncultured Flavobacterium sp.]